jgi:hypothetical protein
MHGGLTAPLALIQTPVSQFILCHGSRGSLMTRPRLCFCLEQSKQQRVDLYDMIALLYDARSSVIHSGTVADKYARKIETGCGGMLPFVSGIEKVVFRSLEFFIGNPEARKDIEHIVFS